MERDGLGMGGGAEVFCRAEKTGEIRGKKLPGEERGRRGEKSLSHTFGHLLVYY